MISVLTLLTIAATPVSDGERALILKPRFKFRVATGHQWDSNPSRAIGRISRQGRPDTLIRALVENELLVDVTRKDLVGAKYVLGAKRFFEAQTEDVVVHDLRLFASSALSRLFHAGLNGQWRQSRVRVGRRDYDLVRGFGTLGLTPGHGLRLQGEAGFDSYGYPTEALRRLDYAGPWVGARLSWRASRALSLSTRAGYVWRGFKGNALANAIDPRSNQVVVSFCDGTDPFPVSCVPQQRNDTEVQFRLRGEYRSSWLAGAEFMVRALRSNSVFEDFNRFRLRGWLTTPLPLGLILNVTGALQIITLTDVSLTQVRYMPEDDENQNSLKVALSYPIADAFMIDARYELFASDFQTNDEARFLRQTAFLGVSYQVGAGR